MNTRMPISSLNYFHCLILACASGLIGDILLIRKYSSDLQTFSNNHHKKTHDYTIITSSNFLALKQPHTQLIKAVDSSKAIAFFLRSILANERTIEEEGEEGGEKKRKRKERKGEK